MDGILNILKPPGMTSFDVVAYLRGVLKTKKIGHTGTLDPGAVGVLPVCIGNATKAIEYMMDKDKLYRAELTLGVTTDTQDSTGNINSTAEVTASDEEIRKAICSFAGKYNQVPPMYSAIKVDGKKLYELARSGKTVERESRAVEIYSIDIIPSPPVLSGTRGEAAAQTRVIFDVACSKGTYIRTLCADIGDRLGCGGHMSFLIRLKAGNFDISSAVTLEDISELSKSNRLYEKLVNVDKVLTGFAEITVEGSDEKKLLNGVFVNINTGCFKNGETVRIYNKSNRFLGLGEFISREGFSRKEGSSQKEDTLLLKIKKMF